MKFCCIRFGRGMENLTIKTAFCKKTVKYVRYLITNCLYLKSAITFVNVWLSIFPMPASITTTTFSCRNVKKQQKQRLSYKKYVPFLKTFNWNDNILKISWWEIVMSVSAKITLKERQQHSWENPMSFACQFCHKICN